MVELLAGAGAAAAASTATTAAATTAAATTAAATTATTASTVMSILQGVATVAGVLGTLSAASAQSQQAQANAVQADLEEGQEVVVGEQKKAIMTRELLKVLGENDVAIAASGIDLTGAGGIGETARRDATKAAARELSIERNDLDMRRALMKIRGQGYRRAAKSYQQGGMLAAAGEIAGYGISLFERG